MENTNISLAYRQVDIIRKNLLAVFRFAVKALIDKACFCSIDDSCEEFINFCATMEHILQHRLRPSKAWYLGDDRSHFWFYIKAACHRQDLRGCIINIDNIENIKSPVAKGRAFVRCALMEKRLSEYVGEALKQTNITRRYYKPGAIMLGEEATELCGTLLGLNSIDFGFCIKGENYDTVECPLAISYTSFMKFRQSPESLHSDLEEMRELSCGSSLASEDGQEGQDAPHSDSWPERYNTLHKRYMRVLEQKSFLEEVAASQEKALQAAATAQQEVGRMQREAAFQKHQYEGVILELQAQVTRMKTINEALQQQLMAARNPRFPMAEMEHRAERGGESSRFAAAMGHKLDSDRHSLTSSCDRSSVGKPAGDTRSLASAMSEISVDVVSQGPGASRAGEDTQSMVPLTGSLGDLHLDLEPGTAVSESSNVTNPEQATPVVAVSFGIYSSAFVEINGNGGEESNIHLREASLQDAPAVQVTQSGEGAGDHPVEESSPQSDEGTSPQPSAAQVVADAGSGEASGHQREEHAGSGQGREEAASMQENAGVEESPVPLQGREQGSDNLPDRESEGSATSEPEELVPEAHSGGEEESSAGDHDSQDPEILSHMSSSKESALASSDKEDSSEPEVLPGEDENVAQGNLDASLPEQEAASPSTDHCDKESSSDPEIIDEDTIDTEGKRGDDPADETADVVTGEGAASITELPSSDREETSEPELLIQEEVSETESNQDPTSDQGQPTCDTSAPQHQQPDPTQSPSAQAKLTARQPPESRERAATPAEEGEKEGVSDSGSSDENRDTWDMLSDANHESSS